MDTRARAVQARPPPPAPPNAGTKLLAKCSSLTMFDSLRVTIHVFLLCSSSGDAYTASAFLSQAEAEEAAARMVATLLAKSPDDVDPRAWRHELDALNRL